MGRGNQTRGSSRRRRAPAVFAAALAAVLLAAAAIVTAAGAAARPGAVTRADRAATHAYLAAGVALTEAVFAALPANVSAVQAVASRIGDECPAVLAQTPPEETLGSPPHNASPRQIGEASRRAAQLEALKQELGTALRLPIVPADTEALATFAAAVRPLRWSDPAITKGVQDYLALVGRTPAPRPQPNVCADMRAWVASGYRTLSPATKVLNAAQEEGPEPPIGDVVAPSAHRLARFEGPAEKRLLRRLRARPPHLGTLTRSLYEASEHADAALGIRSSEPREPDRPVKGSVVIGAGRTAAGESFVARVEPATAGEDCDLKISGARGSGSGLTMGGGSPCRFGSQRFGGPNVSCNEGRLSIWAETPPATRRVRLRLSDGSEITSPALIVPPRLGGPAGFYYQVVRGPSPIPVSLTELDAAGRTLRVVRLPAIVECTKHPLKFLPGGIRTLVHGSVPGGARFTIRAQRYRFLGHVHLDLNLDYAEPEAADTGSGVLGRLSFGNSKASPPPFSDPRVARIFSPEESSGCHPTPYAIVYGILRRPGDRLLAQTATGLVPLKVVALPRSLHTAGVLAYGVFTPPPSALLLRDAAGHTLAREPLGESGRAEIEQCEGEAEPGPGG